MEPDERRFWKWADRNQSRPLVPGVRGNCWIWVGARNSHKQPVFHVAGHMVYAAVWLYEREVGPKPKGMQLSPTCREPMCIRPSHRELRPRGSHLRRDWTPTPAVLARQAQRLRDSHLGHA